MHVEVLVEDASGKLLLDSVLPRILGEQAHTHTWRTIPYKGIGRLPKDLRGSSDPARRILLDQLPRILSGYSRSLRGQDAAVVIVVDLDDRDCMAFKKELTDVLAQCSPAPRTLFRIAIEEMEAWLLGDMNAVLEQFPRAKRGVLDSYSQDSVCGTWETLADAVFPGGAAKLKSEGWRRIGEMKCEWAGQIGRRMDIESNSSPSFQAFRRGIERLCGQTDGK